MQMQIVSERQEYDAFERTAIAGILKRLSWPMQIVLKKHADGPQPLIAADQQTALALRGRGLVTLGYHSSTKAPRHSTATTLGRKVIALMLAEEAEMLAITATEMA